MADEKETAAVDTGSDAGAGGAPKDKTKMLVVILIILAILVMVLTPVITIVAVGSIKQKDTAAAVLPDKKEAVEIKLPKVEVNVKDTQGTRIVQVEVVVVVSDAREMGPFFLEQKEGETKGRLRKINDILITIFSSKNLDGLLTTEAKERLKKEIKDSLNDYLRTEAKAEGMVTDVFFVRFIV